MSTSNNSLTDRRSRVIIYGMGPIAKYLVSILDTDHAEIVAFAVDGRIENQVDNIGVIEANQILKYDFDYVVVTFRNAKRGAENLMRFGVERERIILCTPLGDEVFIDSLRKTVDDHLIDYLNDEHLNDMFKTSRFRLFPCTMLTHKNYLNVIEEDYVREQTLALLAEEISYRKLSGSVAELGVYKGDFSRKINTLFPDKPLYLFDTFEGFSKTEVQSDDTVISEKTECQKFKDTNVQTVISSMPHPEQCIVKKGFFPDTFDLTDVKFCFVSIDVDLYAPILSGLEIFYPLLETGGYIMVHDYNNGGYQGAKAAVREFSEKNGVPFVPLPDLEGSVVLKK